jgi:acetone carboxylase gamma subunit
MTVRDLIAKLQQFDPDMTVCVADWNEQYRCPDEGAAEEVEVVTEAYWPKVAAGDKPTVGTFVRIGGE